MFLLKDSLFTILLSASGVQPTESAIYMCIWVCLCIHTYFVMKKPDRNVLMAITASFSDSFLLQAVIPQRQSPDPPFLDSADSGHNTPWEW